MRTRCLRVGDEGAGECVTVADPTMKIHPPFVTDEPRRQVTSPCPESAPVSIHESFIGSDGFMGTAFPPSQQASRGGPHRFPSLCKSRSLLFCAERLYLYSNWSDVVDLLLATLAVPGDRCASSNAPSPRSIASLRCLTKRKNLPDLRRFPFLTPSPSRRPRQ